MKCFEQKKNSLLLMAEQFHRTLPSPLYELFEWYIPDLWFRYLTPREVLQQLLINRHNRFKIFSHKEIIERKKSDTLFICGTSAHVDEIGDATWDKINEHDTLALNYFIYHKNRPTYFALNYGRDDLVNIHHEELIRKRNNEYKNTIFLISSRKRRRGVHPRIMPQFFTDDPKVTFFLHPKSAKVPDTRSFCSADFKQTMFFRSSLNLYLYVARLFEYRKIVLLGCEMNSGVPFHEDYPEAQWMHQIEGYQAPYAERKRLRYNGTYDSKGKHNLVTTIMAINEYVFKPEGIELYVFNEKSVLYPQIPLYVG
tara:strand:+ start:127 stop:1059 length:933 start_codon:yes stop_codon:yes gene_type:complete